MKIIIAISLIFLLSCSTSVEKESRDEERRANAQKTSDLLNQIAREKTPPTPFPTLTPSPTPTTIPIPLEDLRQMLDLAEDSLDAANKKYNGKKIRIEGRIKSLRKNQGKYGSLIAVDIIPKLSDSGQMSGARCEYVPLSQSNDLRENELLVITGTLTKYSKSIFGDHFIIEDCYIDEYGTYKAKEQERIREDKISAYFDSIGPLAELYLSESEFPVMYPKRVLSGELLSWERTETGIKAEILSQISHVEIVNIKLNNFDNPNSVFQEKLQEILTSIENRGGSPKELETYGVYDFIIIDSGDLYILNEILCISDFEYDYSNLQIGEKVEIFGKFSFLTDDFLISLNDCADVRRYPKPFSYEVITAEDLIREFDNDKITATKKYENKYLQVTGIISKIQPAYDLYVWVKNHGSGMYDNNEYGVIGKYGNVIFEMNHKGTIETDMNVTLHLSRLQMEKIINNTEPKFD